MAFNVVTLTLVLLVQITYQGKLTNRRKQLIHLESKEYFGDEKNRDTRQFNYLLKLFNVYRPDDGYQNPQAKTRFLDIMKFIMHTPDYGLKYTEDHQTRRHPTIPGFHNLIEVRGPISYRYIPERLQEYRMPRIHKQYKYKMENRFQITPRPKEVKPKKYKNTYQLHETHSTFNRERFSIWDTSDKSYIRSPGSDLVKTLRRSTPINKIHERRHFITKACGTTAVAVLTEVAATSSNPMMQLEPLYNYKKLDLIPYEQVTNRNSELDSDEDEDEEISRFIEYY